MKRHQIAMRGLIDVATTPNGIDGCRHWSPDFIAQLRKIALPEHRWGSKNWPEIAEVALYCAGLTGPDQITDHYQDELQERGLGWNEGLSTVYQAWDFTAAVTAFLRAQRRGDLVLEQVAREWIAQWLRWAHACAVPTPAGHRFWAGSTILWPGQRSHDHEPGAVAAVYDWCVHNRRMFKSHRHERAKVRHDNYLWPLFVLKIIVPRGAFHADIRDGGPLCKLWMPIDIYDAEDGSKLVVQPPNKNDDVNTNTPPLIVCGYNAHTGQTFSQHPHTKRRQLFARQSRAERRWDVREESGRVWSLAGSATRHPVNRWRRQGVRYEKRSMTSVLRRKAVDTGRSSL